MKVRSYINNTLLLSFDKEDFETGLYKWLIAYIKGNVKGWKYDANSKHWVLPKNQYIEELLLAFKELNLVAWSILPGKNRKFKEAMDKLNFGNYK